MNDYLRIKTFLLVSLLFISFRISCQEKNIGWEVKDLSENTINNIEALSKTYGYIRYFYPNDNLKKFDWYKFLIYSVGVVEDAKSTEELQQKLYELFSPLCPDIYFSSSGKIGRNSNAFVVYPFYIQKHEGRNVFESGNIEYVKQWKDVYPIPDSMYSFPISPDLYVHFPIAVIKLPENKRELNQLNKKMKKIRVGMFEQNTLKAFFGRRSDKTVSFLKQYKARMADIILRRNIIQHFYPYYEEAGLAGNWDSLCNEYYHKVAVCTNQYDFYYVINELMHHVKDFHITVFPTIDVGVLGGYLRKYYPDSPFHFAFSGNAYELFYVENDSLFPVEEINGMSVAEVMKKKMSQQSYSTYKSGIYKLNNSSDCFSSFLKDSVVTLKLPGQRQISFSMNSESFQNNNLPDTVFIKQINDSVTYINSCSSSGSYKQFLENRDLLEKSAVLIMDIRGYPQEYTMTILAHCIDSDISLGSLKEPAVYFPDRMKDGYKNAEKWFIAPASAPHSKEFSKKYEYHTPENFKLNARLYFLAAESSVSFSETLLEMIKHYKIGTIAGDYTAGCNGDAVYIPMPFGSFMMTVCKFTFRDGSQHHGIGIEPDIFVTHDKMDPSVENAFKFIYDEKRKE